MENHPKGKVSIVMPMKNAAPCIHECLDSIVAQTYQHWELIIVNDHSEDRSAEIAKFYMSKDDRITVLNNDGHGIIDALNCGYQRADGAYIHRMDSDDLMCTNKLSSMVDILVRHGHQCLAVGQVKYFNTKKLGDGYRKYAAWLNALTLSGDNFKDIYKECVIPSPAWMCTREDFDKMGGFQNLCYPEDYDLAYRFYEHGLKCVGTQEVVHLWRDYDERTSRNDPRYADNRFLELKISRFVELDYRQGEVLKLIGAGKKGKRVARLLSDKGISFSWYTSNTNKIGHYIFGIEMQDLTKMAWNDQILVAIAGAYNDTLRQREFPSDCRVFFLA